MLGSAEDPVVLAYGRPRYRLNGDSLFEPSVLPLPVTEIHEAFVEWNPVPDGQDGDLDDLLSPSVSDRSTTPTGSRRAGV